MKRGEVEEKRVNRVLKSLETEVEWSGQVDISHRELAGEKFDDMNFGGGWER